MSGLIKYEAACRALAECKAVDEVKVWADKAAFLAYGRATFFPSARKACEVCGHHKSLTHAHHIIPLSLQWDRGLSAPNHTHTWLCPTHHAAVHVLIGQGNNKSTRASKACIAVVNDLADERLNVLRSVLNIVEGAWK